MKSECECVRIANIHHGNECRELKTLGPLDVSSIHFHCPFKSNIHHQCDEQQQEQQLCSAEFNSYGLNLPTTYTLVTRALLLVARSY